MDNKEYEVLINNFNLGSAQLDKALQVIVEYSRSLEKLNQEINNLHEMENSVSDLPISELSQTIKEQNKLLSGNSDTVLLTLNKIQDSIKSLERRSINTSKKNAERFCEIFTRLDRIQPLIEECYYTITDTFCDDNTDDLLTDESEFDATTVIEEV